MDAEYPDNKLTGATFEVYKDTNENGKIDDGDELIGNLEETETGIYEMKEDVYKRQALSLPVPVGVNARIAVGTYF